METKNEKTDKMPNNRVILMSIGRYNPPTLMHLRMFERARDHLHLLRTHTVVGGIISPVHDQGTNTELENSAIRCDLIKLALLKSDWIRLSTYGIQDDRFKSIKEILKYHQNELNSFLSNGCDNNIYNEVKEWTNDLMRKHTNEVPIQIKLLGGSDMLKNLLSSGLYSDDEISEILSSYGLVIISREGENINKIIYESDILTRYAHMIHIVMEWIPTEINSSRIRRALKCGESVKYLLDSKVIDAIYKYSIYNAKRLYISERKRMDPSKSAMSSSGGGGECRVVLMSCGSYNPPTHMHLRMFERARDHLHNLGTHVVVGGVISPVNDAYGKKDLASSVHRCAMLKLALQDSDWIRLSTWEMRQSIWTRTRASLQHHQELLDAVVHGDDNMNTISNEDLDWVPDSVRNNEANEQTPVRIKLLCGGDLLESFATPGLWADEDITEIVGQYGLICITREGSNPYKFIYDSDILTKHLHNIQIVTEWIPNEVSSTRIRRALKRGESVKYLLQDPVIDYVYANGIYGAARSSTFKLDSLSTHSSTDFLDTDDDTKYHTDNAFLTPSPSDITMLETCPGAADATTTSENLPDSVVNKNLHNSNSPRQSDDQSSATNSNEDTELAREKFFRSINDSLNIGGESSSSLLQISNHIFSQINSPIELPGSVRARNELLAFEDTTESELATLCDNTYSEDREDILSITYEESSDDLNELSVKNLLPKDDNDDSDKDTAKDEVIESLSYDNLDNTLSQDTKLESCEIDGKYHKSLVSTKKCLKKLDENEDDDGFDLENEELPEEPTNKISAKEKDETVDEIQQETKIFKDDISYIKRLRLIINEKPTHNQKRQQLQGSLDSINQNEILTGSNNTTESISKKSKSFESIKRNESATYKPTDYTISNYNSTVSQMMTGPDLNAPTDEFCTTCCYATNNDQPSSADVFYTVHSNCSSPGDEDSTECDICSSCNLRDSEDLLDDKQTIINESVCEEEEICEICGEPATSSTDDLLAQDDSKAIYMRTRPMPLNLPKAKSTLEISRGTYRRSNYEDDRFEIDNCGLQDCRLRASLDTCNKPEPLYVNLIPRNRQFVSGYDSRKSSNYMTDQTYSESEYRNRRRGYSQEHRYAQPHRDEISMLRNLTVSGGKRLSRKGSYAKKSPSDKPQEKRRYSSVDNLQNRTSFRTGEKFSKSRENRFMTSADSIRPARVGRSRSLRRSADNVGRFDSSGDNLDSLDENVDTDENGTHAGDSDEKARKKDDTIKMILTKHGIKVISQKETVL